MSNIYYTKFVKFLEKHNLYDKTFFEFFWKNSVFIDLLDDDFSYLIGGTIIVLDTKNKLKEFFPHMPYINSDKAVAISIYTYVQALIQISRIGKKENYNSYFNYILPMFYEKIFINENLNDELIIYNKNLRYNLLKDNYDFYKSIIENVDFLYNSYINKKLNDKQIGRYAKRLAKESNYLHNKR